jgi:hypothetical protein
MSRRNELMIVEDRATVCELFRRGYRSRTEIASIMNENRDKNFHVTPSQVGDDLQFMKNKLIEKGIEDLSYYRNTIVDELNHLQRAYWRGYDLSRRTKITLESEAVTDSEEYDVLKNEGLGLKPDEDVFARNVRTREEQRAEGNPAFLAGVQTCIDRKAKIYGVDAPSKVALTDPSGNNSATNVFDVLISKLDEAEKRNNMEASLKMKELTEGTKEEQETIEAVVIEEPNDPRIISEG